MVFSACGQKNQPEEQQEALKVMQYSDALQIAEDMGKWLRDPSLEAIKKRWSRAYEVYFYHARKSSQNKLCAFAGYSFDVADQSFSNLRQVVSRDPGQMRGGLPIVRVAFYKAIKAIAVIDPSVVACLEATETEINKIGGGCASGACPFISPGQVKPENEKIKKMVACAKNVFDKLNMPNSQEINAIAQKGCAIADEAETGFKQKTNGYDLNKFDAHLLDLLEQYAKAIAMLTIALKALAETHPDLQAAQN